MPVFTTLLLTLGLILAGLVPSLLGYLWGKTRKWRYNDSRLGRIWFEAEEELKEEIKQQRRKEMMEQGVYVPEPVQVVIKHEDTATLNFLENMKQSNTEDSLKKIEESLRTIERNTLHSSDSPMNVTCPYNYYHFLS